MIRHIITVAILDARTELIRLRVRWFGAVRGTGERDSSDAGGFFFLDIGSEDESLFFADCGA